jgi:phage terminase large subunit
MASKKNPPTPPPKPGALHRRMLDTLKRSRSAVVPPAYQFLFDKARVKVSYGGRGAGRSWSFARALVLRAQERKTRILCAREFQSSITESVHRLLSDQVELLGFGDFFEVQTYTIGARNGSEFMFEGLHANVSKIKSLEGIDIVWIEEGEAITEHSWATLTPTIRKKDSEIWCTFNPHLASDPTYKRFVTMPLPNAIVRKTTFRDNPFFPAELEDERLYLQSVDDDAYRWIWEGECRTISDALILKGKFFVEPFEIDPAWSGPHHGLDFGFSRDPSAAVQLYIDDVNKVLYVRGEYWELARDIDSLPQAIETAIPGISQHVVFCDNSRPESISYLQRHGVAGARAADKWSGSVADGIAFLRSFQKIIIHPTCKRFLDEARNYCFKVDRLTGSPMPEPAEGFDHLIDSARYALSPLIRNLPQSGFFSRSGLLVKGQPAEVPPVAQEVYGILATTDRPASAAAFIIFASNAADMPKRLVVCDWEIVEPDTALTVEWLASAYARLRAAAKQYRMLSQHPPIIYTEDNSFGQAAGTITLGHAYAHPNGPHMHVQVLEPESLPTTIDERAEIVRTDVNGTAWVKLSHIAHDQQAAFRNTTTNHLTSQIFGYKPAAKDTPQELVNAFCTGVFIAADRNT